MAVAPQTILVVVCSRCDTSWNRVRIMFSLRVDVLLMSQISTTSHTYFSNHCRQMACCEATSTESCSWKYLDVCYNSTFLNASSSGWIFLSDLNLRGSSYSMVDSGCICSDATAANFGGACSTCFGASTALDSFGCWFLVGGSWGGFPGFCSFDGLVAAGFSYCCFFSSFSLSFCRSCSFLSFLASAAAFQSSFGFSFFTSFSFKVSLGSYRTSAAGYPSYGFLYIMIKELFNALISAGWYLHKGLQLMPFLFEFNIDE